MSAGLSETGLLQRTHVLGEVLGGLTTWLDAQHAYPLSDADRRDLRSALDDLRARTRHWEAEPSLLTVVLIGGTGVGKSTLLNALASATIASAGIVRPTTSVPTVYHHRAVSLQRLDPVFAHCHAVSHDRPELRHQVLVDTPDMDGNVAEHHQRLLEVLPVADVVLYVGSQEKYHDQGVWKLLVEHRGSRGFAFVLNKWDRCKIAVNESTGRSPDEDFLRSLRQAGFENPRLFRTQARHWANARSDPNAPAPTIEDDFLALERWLERELDIATIRDIKTRGMVGKLDELLAAIDRLGMQDWEPHRARLRSEWETALRQGLAERADALLAGADRFAADFERVFSDLGRQDIRGVFGTYLQLVSTASRFTKSVIPRLESLEHRGVEELAVKAAASVTRLGDHSDTDSLHSRLLAIADQEGWPIEGLEEHLPKQGSGRLDDRLLADTLASELNAIELELADPRGAVRARRLVVRTLCEWGPSAAAVIIAIKWLYDVLFGTFWGMTQYITALMVLVLWVGLLHFLLSRTVPVRWEALRERLRRMIEDRLLDYVGPAYFAGMDKYSAAITAERKTLRHLRQVMSDLRDHFASAERSGPQESLFSIENSRSE